MNRSSTSGPLKALIRTAEWSVDVAQVCYGEALRMGEQSQQALDKAQHDLESSHDRLRQLLSTEILDTSMLQYQQLQIMHYQTQLTVCDQQHLENMQRVEMTHQELLRAKLDAETFLRLKKRRELEEERVEKQKTQWRADESGVIRSAMTRDSN